MSDNSPKRHTGWLILIVLLVAGASAAVSALLVTIFRHKQESRQPFVRLVEVDENTIDPAKWGINWPKQYDQYLRTVEPSHTNFGGGDAHLPKEKAIALPFLTRMFAGYAFSLDYRDRRGHAYMLMDQANTRRVTERPQPGSCLHCHASIIPFYKQVGGGDMFKGFAQVGAMPYNDALAALQKSTGAHPVSCVDCHDPATMKLRVTRPGFILGIQALAAGTDPVPHLASIQRWRDAKENRPYDPNKDATRQEMRSFVCGQCHVEYYCGPKTTLFFPWNNGLNVDQIESYYNQYQFKDGHRFYDWTHAETGAEVIKAQHPEFETWSQGIHARSGVACADCHMPYMREGAYKISDHWVRSPLLMVNRSCQVCHPWEEAELKARAEGIQQKNFQLLKSAGNALTDLLDAVKVAKSQGATTQQLQPALEMQRRAQWRLDFVAAENSMGFHAPQETARVLGNSIDFARQGQIAALKFNAPATQPSVAQTKH